MRPALDFSFVRPDPAELERIGYDALSYTGGVRPSQDYLDELRARGVAFTFIQETYHERAQEGYNAGVLDAQFADKRADERNYPRDAAIYYAVSDKNRGDPNWNGDKIAAYARGIGDATSRPHFGVYGNRYACDAAQSGSEKCRWTWVPVTWDADPSRDALIQQANTPPPIDGTDLNSVHTDFYGQWGTTPPIPPPTLKEPDVLYRATNDSTINPAVRAGTIWDNAGTRFLAVDPNQIPAGAVVRDVPGDDIGIVAREQGVLNEAAARVLEGATGQGSGPTPGQRAAVEQAVALLRSNGIDESNAANVLSAAFG